MPWLYCHGCSEQLPYPTPREIGDQGIICPKCGEKNDPRVSVGDYLAELTDILTKLTARVQVLEAQRLMELDDGK